MELLINTFRLPSPPTTKSSDRPGRSGVCVEGAGDGRYSKERVGDEVFATPHADGRIYIRLAARCSVWGIKVVTGGLWFLYLVLCTCSLLRLDI